MIRVKTSLNVTIDLPDGNQVELGIGDWKISKTIPATSSSPEEGPEIEITKVIWPFDAVELTSAEWDKYVEPNLTKIEDAIMDWEIEHYVDGFDREED